MRTANVPSNSRSTGCVLAALTLKRRFHLNVFARRDKRQSVDTIIVSKFAWNSLRTYTHNEKSQLHNDLPYLINSINGVA